MMLRGQMTGAHRIVYEAAHGPISKDQHVLHKCDVRDCVNLAHLYLGSNEENIADKCKRDRSGKKLTIDDVRLMRRMAIGGMKRLELAQFFEINPSNVTRAISGERWGHIPMEE